ncbi:hypothetical protein [Caldimonas sp. KR1-144]|uniref:hypothetical protein n=1 Tax=Caldimonas sp. KR1-144 TaxID=3400911 RepID=UPI003C00234D
MQAVHCVIGFAMRVLGSVFLAGAALLFSLWAMRPYDPPSAVLQVTYPEFLFSLCVAALVFAVAMWRLLRGSSVGAEVGKLTNAALGDDHLG